VALSKHDKSAIVRLAGIRIWQNNKPDDDAEEALVTGADDQIFRLDRRRYERMRLPGDRSQGIGSNPAQMIAYLNAEEAMHRRNLLWGAASALSAAFAVSRAAAEAPAQGKLRVVYHLSDLEKVNFVMGNIQNHLDGVGGPDNVTIALVVHGPALKAFHAAKVSPDLANQVGQFSKAGLELAACGNTMRSQNVTLSDLIPGFVSADKGGVVRIAELQSQGYLYLRP
jgi:intracellular sulfur oxidation DsrE/DsrF family protein